MSKFYNRTNHRKGEPADAGSPFMATYLETIDDNGVKKLKKTGETNLYGKIQANLEATDIYKIIERYEQGDNDILEKAQGIYGDITEVPTSLIEARQRIDQIEMQFSNLPLEIKEKFSNSPTEYIAQMAKGTGIEIFEKYIQSKQTKKDEQKGEEE